VDLWQRFADGWHNGLLAFDREFRVVALNAPAAALFGSTVPDVAGRTLSSVAPAAALVLEPLVARAFAEANVFVNDLRPFGGDETFSAMTHHLRTSGDEDLVAFTLHRESDGNWPTDDGWAHRELAFANRLLQAYTDNTSLGFVRWDDAFRIVEWSPRAAEIFGYRAGDVRGKTFVELGLVHPDDLTAVVGVNKILPREKRANVVENRNITRDGRVLHCRWFNSYIPTDGGFQIVSLVDDVTALETARSAALDNEQRFRSLFDYSPDAMLALSLEGTTTAANAASEALLAYSRGTLAGTPLDALIAPPDGRVARDALARASRGHTASNIEITALRGDGATVPVLATMIPIVFQGSIGGVHLLARDLSAIRRAERDVAAQSDRLRELYLVAAASNATAENQIAATIDAGCRLLGMTSGALYDGEADRSIATVGEPMPRRLARLSLGTDGALALDDLRGLPYLLDGEFGEEPPCAYIGTAIDIAGTRYGSLCFAADAPRAEPFRESDRDLVQLMGALVASAIERGRSRTRLKHLAYNDQLTALPNRAWFTERLRDEIRYATEAGTRVAVMFLDLDRFKDINDTLGHALGDRMLRLIGDRLTGVVGGDGLVARMGGDEFIVMIGNDPTTQRLDALAERVILAIDQPLVIDGFEQFVTTSVGIAVHPADGDDADTLIKHADVAMYRAKERGRNTHQFFTPSLGAALRTRISQEKSLRKALEREEFVIHYQPQFDLAGERLVSLEALVRWQHPRLGLVLPDQFIPSAEMSGLIVALGDWVLETAAAQVRAWHATVPDLRLAVNLSGRQFHQTALVSKICNALERSGLQPGQLEVEITESVAMSDAALSSQILKELGRAGVRLAVDDFGTGYSSLGYLRRFPLDCLKIDKSFVRDIMVQRDDAIIVKTVIAMAHSLGLEVCAEGVETHEQVAFLRQERCDRVQGYLYARPMSVEDTTAFLVRRGITAAVG
jgi:diguanylate cyclase (GGDEF)-like protein/PAS domain S-box-containing protein